MTIVEWRIASGKHQTFSSKKWKTSIYSIAAYFDTSTRGVFNGFSFSYRSAIYTYKTWDPSFSVLHFWSNLTRRQVNSNIARNGKYHSTLFSLNNIKFLRDLCQPTSLKMEPSELGEPAYVRAFKFWKKKIYKAKIVLNFSF